MAKRAIFKSSIRFKDIDVPVKLYSAVEARDVHFRLLHERDQVPIEQKMVNPKTDQPVAYREAARGYPTENGVLVVLKEDELAAMQPATTRQIEILRFVEPELVNAQWYDRPYFLGPDGDSARYFALAAALSAERKQAIAHFSMRKQEYVATLRPEGDYLALITLRRAEEVITAADLPAPRRALDAREQKMAEQLIGMFEDSFDPAAYHDEFRERVLEFVAAKARGKAPRLRKVQPRKTEQGLSEALALSLKQGRRHRAA